MQSIEFSNKWKYREYTDSVHIYRRFKHYLKDNFQYRKIIRMYF